MTWPSPGHIESGHCPIGGHARVHAISGLNMVSLKAAPVRLADDELTRRRAALCCSLARIIAVLLQMYTKAQSLCGIFIKKKPP